MTIDIKSRHITPVGGNVFADLGFEPSEAAALKAEVDMAIAERKAIKLQLMSELAAWMVSEALQQAEAARILGVTRPRVSDLLRMKVGNFTIDALMNMLVRAGRQVRVSVVVRDA